MTWVRYDDNVRNHPKVEPLDDATYRLWREAIEWCAQNLTDGVILARQLGLTSTRASNTRARKLAESGLWHRAGGTCESECCPPSGVDGWVIHDYFDYQPRSEKVRTDQEAKRERQRKWLEKARGGKKDAPRDASLNGTHDASKDGNPAPPRPAPIGRGGATHPQRLPAANGGRAPAGVEVSNLVTPRCRIHGHERQPADRCTICAADAKARPTEETAP